MIENEVKYALRDVPAVERALQGALPWTLVEQGYLNGETRVRRFSFSDGRQELVFSFKRRLATGENVEIETELTPEAFALLWPTTGERLVKRRFKFADGVVHWDVDFFQSAAGTYFGLAEVEMPSGMREPPGLPALLAPYIAFAVDRDDDRFLSRKLSDEAYARRLAADIGLA